LNIRELPCRHASCRFAALLVVAFVLPHRAGAAEPPRAPEGFIVLSTGPDFTNWHGLRSIDVSKLAQMPEADRAKLLADDMEI